MRTNFDWAGLRNAGVALAFGLTAMTPIASANEIETTAVDSVDELIPATPTIRFSSSGSFGDSGISNGNLLNFNGILQQNVQAPSNFSFGEFQVLPDVGENISTTYDDTPFTLAMTVGEVNGGVPELNETPIFINGLLNGTISGETQSNVTATFNTSDLPSFKVGDYTITITKLDPVDIAPFTTNGGRTSIQGRIEAQTVPEPASIAVFLVALAGGIGMRRRALARKAA